MVDISVVRGGVVSPMYNSLPPFFDFAQCRLRVFAVLMKSCERPNTHGGPTLSRFDYLVKLKSFSNASEPKWSLCCYASFLGFGQSLRAQKGTMGTCGALQTTRQMASWSPEAATTGSRIVCWVDASPAPSKGNNDSGIQIVHHILIWE